MGRERQRQPPKCHVKLLFTTTGNSFVLYFSSLVFFFVFWFVFSLFLFFWQAPERVSFLSVVREAFF